MLIFFWICYKKMSLLFIMKKFKPLSVKTFVYLFSSTTHSVLKKKVPLINLKKIKEDLEKPLDVEKPSDVDREKPKVEEKVSKAYEKPIKKDKDSLHKYFILKEKEISSKILKCSSEKELLKIYFEENQKK